MAGDEDSEDVVEERRGDGGVAGVFGGGEAGALCLWSLGSVRGGYDNKWGRVRIELRCTPTVRSRLERGYNRSEAKRQRRKQQIEVEP